ncbi:MAG: beta-propeller domain-containing protein [Anaerotruncus sp.]|nr:beta-propeller domain-containing protein [Anaerotruncus sp.]
MVVFDTADKNDVTIDRELAFDNTYLVQSRMIGSMLYLVLDNYQINYGFEGDDFIPVYSDSFLGTEPITIACRRHLLHAQRKSDDSSYLMLVSLDIEAERSRGRQSVSWIQSYQIYMSLNNLYSIVYRYDYNETTQIYDVLHRDSPVRDRSRFEDAFFAAVPGIVAGSPLNQFSMDEYNGVFRIATTHWTWNNRRRSVNDSTTSSVGRRKR